MKKQTQLLDMLMLLGGNRIYTKEELRDRFHLSERSFYRNIRALRDAGFIVRKKELGYTMDKIPKPFKSLDQLPHFTQEEASLFYKAIHSFSEETYLKEKLLKKLHAIYDIDEIAHVILSSEAANNVQLLIEAVKKEQQVWLRAYRSGNSGKVSDRLIEPFEFTTNYVSVWAFEPTSQKNKLFKTARIGQVEKTATRWRYATMHKKQQVDAFRMSSERFTPVRLRLNMQAANLLVEEYPLSAKDLHQITNNVYEYTGQVATFDGVGRFILGLPDAIEVLAPEELKDFLNKKQKKN